MKKNSSTRSAFINPRTLIGFVLLLMGALLALFAFGAAPHLSNSNAQAGNSPGWFGRFASAFGVHLDSQKLASLPAAKGGGAGAPLFKPPENRSRERGRIRRLLITPVRIMIFDR